MRPYGMVPSYLCQLRVCEDVSTAMDYLHRRGLAQGQLGLLVSQSAIPPNV